MIRRPVVAAAICAATIVSLGGTAFAGEITGNGKPTPVAEHRAASICSFSGQNDVPDGSDHPEDPFGAGRVQSFGDIVQEAVKWQPKGASSWVPTIRAEGPGQACRGGGPAED